jgi:hypothetical protein
MGHRESRIAQQDSNWTPFGVAAGESSRDAPYQQQRAQTFLRHCRCLGALAAAAMPAAENSLTAGAGALSLGPGAALVRDATRTRRAHRQYPVLADGRAWTQGSGLGLGARAGSARALRGRLAAVLHAGKRPSGAARSGAPSGSRKRTPLAILRRLIFRECGGIGRRARLRIWWGNPCEFESRLSHHRIHIRYA